VTVLAYRASGPGDLLTAAPALRALRSAFPAEPLVLATSAGLLPFAADLRLADDVVAADFPHPPPVALEAGATAVNLHGRGPESTRALLALSPARLVAFAHPDIPATAGAPVWRDGEHDRVRWCRLLSGHGIPADPDDFRLPPPPDARATLTAAGIALPGRHGATVLHPGAASPARRWPPDRWAELAAGLRRRGREIVVTGGADERPLAHDVARAAGLGAGSVLAGRTDVRALAAVIAGAGLLVSGDTGPAHLATAYGVPSVLLFGPTPPSEWGPPADPRHVVLWAGRRGDPHGALPDPGLLALRVADVLAAVDGRPAGTRPGAGLSPGDGG